MFGGGDLEMGFVGGSVAPRVRLAVESARKGFVRKVYYDIVEVQLVATAIMAVPIATASDSWLREHAALLLASTIGFLILAVCMTCHEHMLRQHPWNLVILGAFTALESVSVGFVCKYQIESEVWCLVATASIVGALTLLAVTTKVDVTGMEGCLRATNLALNVLGLAGMFLRIPPLQAGYLVGGAIILAAYVVGGAIILSGYLVYLLVWGTQMVAMDIVWRTQLVVMFIVWRTQLVVMFIVWGTQLVVMDIVQVFIFLLRLIMDYVRLFIFLLRLMCEKRDERR